jgi:hypothetical protein
VPSFATLHPLDLSPSPASAHTCTALDPLLCGVRRSKIVEQCDVGCWHADCAFTSALCGNMSERRLPFAATHNTSVRCCQPPLVIHHADASMIATRRCSKEKVRRARAHTHTHTITCCLGWDGEGGCTLAVQASRVHSFELQIPVLHNHCTHVIPTSSPSATTATVATTASTAVAATTATNALTPSPSPLFVCLLPFSRPPAGFSVAPQLFACPECGSAMNLVPNQDGTSFADISNQG